MFQLTVGMPTYDDYDGVYFTIQSIRATIAGTELENEIEFLVVDTNPRSKHGELLRKFCAKESKRGPIARYISHQGPTGTALAKERAIQETRTLYYLGVDCHVLVPYRALLTLKNYYLAQPQTQDLIQGPLWLDGLNKVHTHFTPRWRGKMFGTWATDTRGEDWDAPAFDIPMQGMGLFSCRTDAWVGFHPGFREFGGEEGYIHEKFRQAGRRTLCLPGLRWIHRFGRPNGVPYRITKEGKFRNYIIAWLDLGWSILPVYEHFLQEGMSDQTMRQIISEVLQSHFPATTTKSSASTPQPKTKSSVPAQLSPAGEL